MKLKVLIGSAVAVLLSPGIADAGFVLDTGTPTGSGAPVILGTAQWLAGEFAVTAGQDITGLSAYLTQGVGEPGDTFTFDVYSSAGFTGRSSGRTVVYTTTGTFTGNGWNTASVNWTPTTTGDYWLALQVSSTTQTKGLDAPVEASASGTGTAPAIAFAYLGSGTSSEYTTAGAPAIGLEVTAAPVPLPPAIWLLGSGLLGCAGTMARRRRPMQSVVSQLLARK